MSNRLIINNSIILYIRMLVSTFIGIFMSRYVLRALGVSDYGLYNVVGGIVTLMAFINTVMVSTTYRYIAHETGKPDGNVNKIFNVSLTIHIVISLVVVLVAYSIGLFYIVNYLNVPEGKLSDAVFVYCFSLLNIVCVILGTPFQGLLISKEKFSITVPIELSTKFINLGLVILLNFLPGDKLRIYAIFVTMVHLLNPVLYVLYCFRKYYQEVKWKFQKEFGVYRGMIRFSGWIMFGAAASAGEHQGSALIINRFFGTTMNASFGVANQVGSMARMFTHGLSHAVVPQITKSHSAGDHPRSEQLVMLASKYSFFLLLIPALPILLETNYILGVWLTIVPPYTSIFIQMMLIKELIQSSKAGLPALIQASGNIKWFQIITSATSLMVLPISFIAFMLNKPPYFISLIFTITSFVTFVTTLILMRVILDYDVPLYLKRCFSRMLVVTLCMLPLLAINKLLVSGASRFFITLVASEIWLVFMVYLIGMERDERTGMRKYLLSISQTIKIRIGVGNR